MNRLVMTRRSMARTSFLVLTMALNTGIVHAADPVPSPAHAAIDQAAKSQKYTFVLFYKDNGAPTQSMMQTLKDSVARRSDVAMMTSVLISDPADKDLVDRFDISRAPMPMTIAIAPNGAMTGIFAQSLADANVEAAFVTPTMTRCMKSMQEGKLVLVGVHATEKPESPRAVNDFQADPQFKDRAILVTVRANDPAEAKFMKQMQIDPRLLTVPVAVFLAPPGVMIGKFDTSATKEQMAVALHKAGKCCDDPNCKHAQPTQQAQPAPRTTTQAQQPVRR